MKITTIANPFPRWLFRTALAVIAVASPSLVKAETVYFTHVGSGQAGGLSFRTLFQVTNEHDSAVSGSILLTRYDGQPLVAPVESLWLNQEGTLQAHDNRIEFSIPPASSLQLTLNAGPAPLVGWASLESPTSLAANSLAQFSSMDGPSAPGRFEEGLVSEVESVGTAGERSFSFPLTYRSAGRGIDTAFAFVNLGDEEATVTLLRRPDAESEIVLAPGASFSGYLSQVWPMGKGEARYDGLAEVRSAQPLGFLVFRTLGGVPLSGVRPAILAPEPGSPVEAELGVPFTLSPGQSASIPGEDLTVTFDGVLGDSRCPEDVTCVWAGEAISAVTLRKGGVVVGQANLILPESTASSGTFEGYTVTAVRLDPYPNTQNGPIRAEDYRLTAVVERVPD